MNNNLTDITVVLDRSGSMQSCRSDAEGGLNGFVEAQAKQPGDAYLTLVQFDTEYEFVHRGVPIKQVPPFSLEPRGSTALLDAVGRAITETGSRLAAMPEAERPGLVVFAIVTDGLENSSREFTGPAIKAMIEEQTNKYSWKFTYLGANQDAFAVAGDLGIAPSAALNYAGSRSRESFDALAANTSRMRKSSAAGAMPVAAYTKEERAAASGKPK